MAQRKIKTISIPPELAKQVDRYPDENWSAIACQAFEQRLKQLDTMNVKTENDKAVARLRASKERAVNLHYRYGEIAGSKFAMNVGEYDQLQRLGQWREVAGTDYNRLLAGITAYEISKIMGGEDGPDNLVQWFKDEHPDNCNDESWVDGFIDGALAKFEEINEKL